MTAAESRAPAITLGRAFDLLDALIPGIRRAAPSISRLMPGGDVRRFEAMVATVVLVGEAADPPAAIDALCAIFPSDTHLHRAPARLRLIHQRAEIDIRLALPDAYGQLLFEATGSAAHVSAVGQRGHHAGAAADEADVYARAGLAWVAPELRHDTGEIEAAAAGTLPALITREQILGDLHMHTTESDGKDALDVMVAGCAALGYRYVAITDHSERAAAGRTLTADRLARQADDIARLREHHPGLVILHGAEVDILPDGGLDFPDHVMAPLDLVLASLHDSAGHDPARLTARCLAAIRHPLVNVITHPANRLVGKREGYDLDFDAVFAAAVETGTALEIDGAPSHLDMDGPTARAATAAGVTVVIDSDCHRVESLDRQMRFGVGTARRGWVEPRHVLNTRPIADVRAFFAAKRSRTAP